MGSSPNRRTSVLSVHSLPEVSFCPHCPHTLGSSLSRTHSAFSVRSHPKVCLEQHAEPCLLPHFGFRRSMTQSLTYIHYLQCVSLKPSIPLFLEASVSEIPRLREVTGRSHTPHSVLLPCSGRHREVLLKNTLYKLYTYNV